MYTIEERLQEIIASQLCISVDRVTPRVDLTREFGADSLDLMEIVILTEAEFGIEIDDDFAIEIRTLQDLLNYIEKKIDNN